MLILRSFSIYLLLCSVVDGFQSHAPRTRRSPFSNEYNKFAFRSTSSVKFALDATTLKEYDETCDVLVIGSGPAARAAATLISSESVGLDVIVADKNFDKEWVPNYGAWEDEWESIMKVYETDFGINFNGGEMGSSIDRIWKITDCYFGGSFDIPTEQRMRLDRPYYRVDKNALRDSLTTGSYRVILANHISEAINVNMYSPPESLVHDENGSTIKLQKKDGENMLVRAKMIIDATGHETKLVMRDSKEGPRSSPGFQIAYGALVELDESNVKDKSMVGPYDKEAMTLFDYRTDHFDPSDEALISKVEREPTFMYAMPLKDNLIFFEETSLVARPAISFQDCKDRCFTRLKHHGIEVKDVLEEEYCYIPMGGALPARDQRIVGIGGASAMVHPSTGYHLCRVLMGATYVAKAIKEEIGVGNSQPNLDRAAGAAYNAIWSPENIRQRNFAVFGGEYLMEQNVEGLRGFFDGFFRLPVELWGGFLAGWPGLAYNENHESWYKRLFFGLNFVVRLNPVTAFSLFASIVKYSISEGVPLPQSVTPLLGEPYSYKYEKNYDVEGDLNAKAEARRMIQESAVTEDLPVAFSEIEQELLN